MLTKLRLKNFKAWRDSGDIRLAPLTRISHQLDVETHHRVVLEAVGPRRRELSLAPPNRGGHRAVFLFIF